MHFFDLSAMFGQEKDKLIKDFGKKLKKIRIANKLSLRKLALEADMDHMQIALIEKGVTNPTMTTIMAIADALKIHPGELFPIKK